MIRYGNIAAIALLVVAAGVVPLSYAADLTTDQVRELLASSPGQRRVQLLFDRPGGESLRVDAGLELRVELTRDLEQKLMRWLVRTKSERRTQPLDTAA